MYMIPAVLSRNEGKIIPPREQWMRGGVLRSGGRFRVLGRLFGFVGLEKVATVAAADVAGLKAEIDFPAFPGNAFGVAVVAFGTVQALEVIAMHALPWPDLSLAMAFAAWLVSVDFAFSFACTADNLHEIRGNLRFFDLRFFHGAPSAQDLAKARCSGQD